MPYKLIGKGNVDENEYTGKQLAEKLNVSVSSIARAAAVHGIVKGYLIISTAQAKPRRRKCRGCGRWFMGEGRERMCIWCRRQEGGNGNAGIHMWPY